MRASAVQRIKKLLALTRSPNPHEAARARELADEIMRKWGVREEEVADAERDSLEVVDEEVDDYREFLASLAAQIFDCRAVSKGGRLGFRGPSSKAVAAASFYRRALSNYSGAISGGLDKLVEARLKHLSEPVWRFWWWNGFARGVRARRPGQPAGRKRAQDRASSATSPPAGALERVVDEVEAAFQSEAGDDLAEKWESSAASERRGRGEHDVIADMRERAFVLARDIDVQWLKGEADGRGERAGREISLDAVDEMMALRGR